MIQDGSIARAPFFSSWGSLAQSRSGTPEEAAGSLPAGLGSSPSLFPCGSRRRLLGEDLILIRSLGDHDRLVGRQTGEGLCRLAGRPGYDQAGDGGRVAQSDVLDQGITAKAAVVTDHPYNPDRGPIGLLALRLDPGPQRRAVGLDANQLDFSQCRP